MEISFEADFDAVMITPLVMIEAAVCSDEACAEKHIIIQIGWLFWTLILVF